jgi:hypothetical protein
MVYEDHTVNPRAYRMVVTQKIIHPVRARIFG